MLRPLSSPNYPYNSCLRSHINKTETEYALAMITKAGIPSTKVVPSLAFYRHSIEIRDLSCHGSKCIIVGNKTGIKKGSCIDM